jgi:1-aminocyclopropane-1-carboxylate deaminase/D-cysteine desulfhydrase-like pyridoxal-dependent ACC family enzyme
MIARREFAAKETILFWHTGGTPALFTSSSAIT